MFVLHVWLICLHVCLCTMSVKIHGHQKRELEPPELTEIAEKF